MPERRRKAPAGIGKAPARIRKAPARIRKAPARIRKAPARIRKPPARIRCRVSPQAALSQRASGCRALSPATAASLGDEPAVGRPGQSQVLRAAASGVLQLAATRSQAGQAGAPWAAASAARCDAPRGSHSSAPPLAPGSPGPRTAPAMRVCDGGGGVAGWWAGKGVCVRACARARVRERVCVCVCARARACVRACGVYAFGHTRPLACRWVRWPKAQSSESDHAHGIYIYI